MSKDELLKQIEETESACAHIDVALEIMLSTKFTPPEFKLATDSINFLGSLQGSLRAKINKEFSD